jgi:hypothetical protein
MKRSTGALFLLSILFLLAGNCQNRNSSGKKNSLSVQTEKNGEAKIDFRSEMHNFGTLKAGEIVSYSFLFRNIGNKPLKISEITRSCDCINIKYKESPVKPGEESEIEVTLNTSGEWGNVLKTLEIRTQGGEKKTLTIMAYIEDEQINNLLKKEK